MKYSIILINYLIFDNILLLFNMNINYKTYLFSINLYVLIYNMLQGVDVALETLIGKSDSFLRAKSLDVIKGFLTLSMDYNNNNILKLLLKIEYVIELN